MSMIGIHRGEIESGRNDGKITGGIGAREARPLLGRLRFETEDIDHIYWLVAHHHSYGSIDGRTLRFWRRRIYC